MAFMVLLLFVVSIVVALAYAAGIYNQMIGVKVNVEKSWSNIEVLEKQRYDEIPRLVKVCEGYMQYERDTLQKVIAARTRSVLAGGSTPPAWVIRSITWDARSSACGSRTSFMCPTPVLRP